ncbi:MAG: hypothetical protein QXH51_07945, partial [Candidatus Bathyarchaeia archaeon]
LKAIKNNPVTAVIDWVYLPSPANIRLPFALTNMQGGTRYVQTQLLNPPSGWTDSPVNRGSVANGATMNSFHPTQRTMPTFTNGEYVENITLAVKLFKDSNYSDLDVTLTVEYQLNHYKSDDSAWSLLAFHDFESGYENYFAGDLYYDWTDADVINIYRSAPGYASSYSICATYSGQNSASLQVYGASFNSYGEVKANTLEQKFLDTQTIMISGVWIAYFGYISNLTKNYFGIVFCVTQPMASKVLFRQYGYNRPSGATKLRFSGVCRYHTDNYWHIDRIRIVYKTS